MRETEEEARDGAEDEYDGDADEEEVEVVDELGVVEYGFDDRAGEECGWVEDGVEGMCCVGGTSVVTVHVHGGWGLLAMLQTESPVLEQVWTLEIEKKDQS